MFDKNGDQKISGEELYEVMRYLGISATEHEVTAMIQVVDKNSKLLTKKQNLIVNKLNRFKTQIKRERLCRL